MPYDIGAKIGVSGWQEFKRQIGEINKNYKSLSDYSAALEKRMGAEGKSIDALAQKYSVQTRQMDLLEKKKKEINDILAITRKKYSENSTAVMRLNGALVDVENSMEELKQATAETERSMWNLEHGIEDVGDAADSSEGKIVSFGDMFKAHLASGAVLNGLERAKDVLLEVGQASIEAAADVKASNSQFSQTFGDLEASAKRTLQTISEETGIATTRMQGGFTTVYAYLRGLNADAETSMDITRRAMTVAADSSAYYNMTMEEALERLRSFLKGNYENGDALGVAATETTRNAKANELYAKSFQELSESQKVETLLAMVEASNQASGAMGQASREATEWNNTQGEFNETLKQTLAWLGGPVLAGVTPLVRGITGALKELISVSQWEQLNTSVAGFTDGVRSAETALSDSNAEISATSTLAREYVSRLEELEASGLKTADAQREYANTVELLNGLMPDLGLTIDKVTGRLDQNTGSILENIDALQSQIKAQAEQEFYADIIAKQVAVEKELTAARIRQVEIQSRISILQQQGVQSVDRYALAQAEAAGAGMLFWNSLSAQEKELYQLQQEFALNNRAISEGEAATAEYADALNAASDAMEAAKDGAGELAEGVEKAGGTVETLTALYETAKDAARESIDSQIGLFQKLSDESSMSAEEIVANWGKQRQAFINYADNLKKAVDMGLDEALVQQLSDGSEQSMLILDELVNGTDLRIDEINAAFRGVEEGKDYLDKAFGDLTLIAADEFALMVKYAKQSGVYTVDGLVQAIYDNAYRVEKAGRHMSLKLQYGYNHESQINSPSRKMMKAADYTVDGLVLELQARERDVEASMRDLAKAGNSAYLQEQLDYVSQYPSMVSGAPGYGGTTTNNHSVAYGGISINITTQPGQDERAIANAVVQELTARFGREEASF